MKSLRLFVLLAVVLVLATVWVLPVPSGARLFITVVLAFCAVFVFVDATGKGRTFAALTVALLVLYLVVTFQRGVVLLLSGQPVGILLGLGLVVLPVLGAWSLVREVLFASRVQQLADRLEAEGGLPEDDLPRTPAGRIDREAADADFPRWQHEAEEHPEDWRSWFRLSWAYDASGDRKRARRAMRDAVAVRRGREPGRLAAGEK